MQVIADGASRLAPKAGTTAAAPRRRGQGRVRQAAPAAKPIRPRRARATGAATTTRRSANGRAQRGTNALIIEEILKAMAPSPVRPAEIRKALQDNGVAISFASIRHALRQLEARNAAEQVGDSKTWRYRSGSA
jgi:enoyl-CoA hydratase/carnithine racemase